MKNWLLNRHQQVVVDGEGSTCVKVKSGVPQGTVLGPLLFLIYINDIDKNISSQLRLFADDCLIYHPIHTEQDQLDLQKVLDTLTHGGQSMS